MSPKFRLVRQPVQLAVYIATFILLVVYFLQLPHASEHASPESMNIFFGADTWRVAESLKNSTDANHYRDRVHPFFSLVAVTVARLGNLSGSESAPFIVYRTVFGVLGSFLFWLLIYRKTSMLRAYAALALLLSTATVRVWSSLPETFVFGFFTLMSALVLACRTADVRWVLLTSFAGTITNVALGVHYFLQQLGTIGKKRAKELLGSALLIAVATAVLQKALYPTSGLFFDLFGMREERKYVGVALDALLFRPFDFFFSGFALPLQAQLQEWRTHALWNDFIESVVSGRYGIRQWLPMSLAVLGLSLGYLMALSRYIRSPGCQIRNLVAVFIVFQFLLHLVYGDVSPFLYSYHFTPILIIFIVLNLPGVYGTIWTLMMAVLLQSSNDYQRFLQIFGVS